MRTIDVRDRFIDTFGEAGFRPSPALSLVQPSIKTSFLFSVGFVDVVRAIDGAAVELDGAATVQRCFRHFDIERVADGRHLSFFEMAGALRCSDWRTADLVAPVVRYFVEACGLPRERLHATYFGGGAVSGVELESDTDARDAYLDGGIAAANVWTGDSSTNIWFEGANSGTERSGICGPHSEVFFDLAPRNGQKSGASPLAHPDRFLEISNIVTITHRTLPEGATGLSRLPAPLVETALGMERLEMACSGAASVHETPKLRAITEAVRVAVRSPKAVDASVESLRVVVDHVRALTHLMADGGRPGPKGRGHVIRRLFRRLLEAASVLSLDTLASFPALARTVATVDEAINPNLEGELESVIGIFDREATRLLDDRMSGGPS